VADTHLRQNELECASDRTPTELRRAPTARRLRTDCAPRTDHAPQCKLSAAHQTHRRHRLILCSHQLEFEQLSYAWHAHGGRSVVTIHSQREREYIARQSRGSRRVVVAQRFRAGCSLHRDRLPVWGHHRVGQRTTTDGM